MLNSDTFLQLLTVLGSATFVATIFHYLRLPTVVGFIITGILVGPFGLQLVPSVPGAEVITEIGIGLLMFTIGLEFSFRSLIKLRKVFLGVGLVQISLTTLLIAALSMGFLGVHLPKAIFIGFLAAMSSTAIVMKLLEDSRETVSPYGQCSVGVLLFQDLAVIPMMLAIPVMASWDSSAQTWTFVDAGYWALKIIGIFGVIWLGSKYLIPFLFEKVVGTKSRELFFFSVVFLCFGIAFVVEHIGLSLSLGAFIAGVMISESPYGKQVTADIVHMRDNFLGLFFTSVGMLLDTKFFASHILVILGVTLVVGGIKSAIVYVSARWNGYSLSVAAIAGLTLCQVGEFSFILAENGVAANLINRSELQYFLAVSILSMMLTPFLFRLAPAIFLADSSNRFSLAFPTTSRPIKKELGGGKLIKQATLESTIQTIIVGYGPVGQDVAKVLSLLKIPYKVVDLNFEMVRKFKRKGVPILYGDASREKILEEAGIDSARLVLLTVSGASMTRAVLESVQRRRPDVKIIVRAQYLQEAEKLKVSDNTELVVAEFETSLEVLARALRVYGIAPAKIHDYLVDARKQFTETRLGMFDSLRSNLSAPSWEALSSIRPLKLEAGFFAVGKTLGELNLRQHSGASVVCVFRELIGMSIPGGDYELSQGDIVHLIGSPESLDEAENYLSTGSKNTLSESYPKEEVS